MYVFWFPCKLLIFYRWHGILKEPWVKRRKKNKMLKLKKLKRKNSQVFIFVVTVLFKTFCTTKVSVLLLSRAGHHRGVVNDFFLLISGILKVKVVFNHVLSSNVSEEKPMEVEEEEEEDQKNPGNLLDNLFKKTKTTPCLYWLPLTDEQVCRSPPPFLHLIQPPLPPPPLHPRRRPTLFPSPTLFYLAHALQTKAR